MGSDGPELSAEPTTRAPPCSARPGAELGTQGRRLPGRDLRRPHGNPSGVEPPPPHRPPSRTAPSNLASWGTGCAASRREGGRQRSRTHRTARRRQDHQPFELVAQLADISLPRVRQKRLPDLGGELPGRASVAGCDLAKQRANQHRKIFRPLAQGRDSKGVGLEALSEPTEQPSPPILLAHIVLSDAENTASGRAPMGRGHGVQGT